jgi:hypothetical protein
MKDKIKRDLALAGESLSLRSKAFGFLFLGNLIIHSIRLFSTFHFYRELQTSILYINRCLYQLLIQEALYVS